MAVGELELTGISNHTGAAAHDRRCHCVDSGTQSDRAPGLDRQVPFGGGFDEERREKGASVRTARARTFRPRAEGRDKT